MTKLGNTGVGNGRRRPPPPGPSAASGGLDRRPLITIDKLAERLGVTERYIRRLVAERRVPYRKLGKLIRFADHEIAAWLDTTRRPQDGNDRSA